MSNVGGFTCWKPQHNTSIDDYNRCPYQVLDIIEESIYEKSMWDLFIVILTKIIIVITRESLNNETHLMTTN